MKYVSDRMTADVEQTGYGCSPLNTGSARKVASNDDEPASPPVLAHVSSVKIREVPPEA